MIYDAENTFMNQQDLSKGTKSEIMENRGGGRCLCFPLVFRRSQ